jgi:hypothetical protein
MSAIPSSWIRNLGHERPSIDDAKVLCDRLGDTTPHAHCHVSRYVRRIRYLPAQPTMTGTGQLLTARGAHSAEGLRPVDAPDVARRRLGYCAPMQPFLPPSSPRFHAFLASCLFALAGSGLAASGCGGDPDTVGTGGTSGSTATGSGGATSSTTGSGGSGGASTTSSSGGGSGGAAPSNCIEQGHTAGERYAVGDDCNFCDCLADGSTSCTQRSCKGTMPGCTYAGQEHAYAERFPASDGCNECVCAASGLACTRRSCATSEEGAILVESLDTPCGPDTTFTAHAVLDGLPVTDLEAPFLYKKNGPLYPETLPDTKVRFRVVYDGGFAVCRIPAPGQEAFDIEVMVEWITADGAFDEGFHTYLRRNAGGFVDAWFVATAAPPGGLDGTFNPACFDPNGFSFGATINADGTAEGNTTKTCETDIVLTVGSWSYGP